MSRPRSAPAVAPALPRATARRILDRLEQQHPNAWTELHFSNPYELLVATILSAQCTDARVNQVTPALFARYPAPAALAKATPEELEPLIQPTGFFRMKARSLHGMASAVVAHHGGVVPEPMEALVALPGVGRKTANVVRGHAFGQPGLPVDRHVLRVANRIGLAHADDAEKAEAQLAALWPPDRWTRASDTLILHGRRVCKTKPQCDRCQIRTDCAYFRQLGAKASRPVRAGRSAKGRE
jgi:endonuclease-3